MANNFIPGEGLVAGQDFDWEDARLYTLNPADGLYYPPYGFTYIPDAPTAVPTAAPTAAPEPVAQTKPYDYRAALQQIRNDSAKVDPRTKLSADLIKQINDPAIWATDEYDNWTNPTMGNMYAPIQTGGLDTSGGDEGVYTPVQKTGYMRNVGNQVYYYDLNGNFTGAYNNQSGGIGDFVKMLAPIVLSAVAPGLGTAIGEGLLGAGAAGASTVGGAVLGGGVAGLTGGDIGKGALMGGLGGAGSAAGNAISSGLTDTLGSTGANIVGNIARAEIASGGKADPVSALISGGLNAGTNAVLGQIDGFSDLSPALQKSITSTVANTLQTGNVDPSKAISTALAAATSMVNEENAINPYFQTGAGTGDLPSVEEPTAPVTVPTQAEQQPAVDDFIKQIEQYQAPEPTVEQIMASEPPPAVAPAAPVEEPTDTVQALLDSQQPAPTNQAEIDQQTQDLLNYLSSGTDNGTSDNGTPANDQAEWDVPVAPSELQTALDNLPQEQAEWDVPVNPDDLNTALTEIAAPEPNDTPSPTEQDVLDFMKEHPDTSSGTAAKTAATKAAADKAARDKAARDKAAAEKAARDKAANDAFNQLKAQAQAQQNQQDALMKMMSSNNDVAHIKSNTNLFGAIPGMEPPASSAQQQPDPVAALQGMDQQYAIGGHVDDFDVDALLHILRS
jgi:hypothetical protein